MQNSTVAASFGASDFETSDVYLTGNTYPGDSKRGMNVDVFDTGVRNGNAYIYGGGKKVPLMAAGGGNLHIYDCDIGELKLFDEPDKEFETLNMKNVTIRKGYWPRTLPLKGNWENVAIYPEIEMRKGSEHPFLGYNVTFPEGPPWRGATVNITESAKPLEFAKPPVPTLEQLGLAQFWAAVDRGEMPTPPRLEQAPQQTSGKE